MLSTVTFYFPCTRDCEKKISIVTFYCTCTLAGVPRNKQGAYDMHADEAWEKKSTPDSGFKRKFTPCSTAYDMHADEAQILGKKNINDYM